MDSPKRVEAPTRQGKGVQSQVLGPPALLAVSETLLSELRFLYL